MSDVSAANRLRVRSLAPHARRHAEMLLWEFPLLIVSSAYRSPTRNRRVGGAPNSFHVRRRAIDVTGPAWDLGVAAARAWDMRVGPGCTGPEEVLLEYMGTPRQHLHLAW